MNKLKYIKLFIALIIMMILLCGCSVTPDSYSMEEDIVKTQNFWIIRQYQGSMGYKSIYVDKKTRVMYLEGHPMVDPDGNILLYEED